MRNYKVVWPNINKSVTVESLPLSENKVLNDNWSLKYIPGGEFIIPADAKLAGL